jgi:UDP-GlcNAc:undecaprenyl-phosphate/decaprenyl-phosphate GlcNAc-1-phosphate transferase
MILFFLTVILFIAELFYFKIAKQYNIIDKPNERSAHSEITIRGGGIIFLIAAVIYFFYTNFYYPYYIFGLISVSIISFIDDIYTLSNRYRLPFQFLAINLVLFETNYSKEPIWVFIGLLIIGVGILNAYNFMDGINGITGGYSLVAIITFWYINNFINPFIENDFLYFTFISLLIFNFFNFRTKAKCFAGDVGSVSIAVIIIFLVLKLINLTNQYYYILILAVYGVDSVLTIIHRIIKKENIFKAHNSHFFQLLAKNNKMNHLKVSGIYMIIQFIINTILIYVSKMGNQIQIIISLKIIIVLASLYIIFKPKIANG